MKEKSNSTWEHTIFVCNRNPPLYWASTKNLKEKTKSKAGKITPYWFFDNLKWDMLVLAVTTIWTAKNVWKIPDGNEFRRLNIQFRNFAELQGYFWNKLWFQNQYKFVKYQIKATLPCSIEKLPKKSIQIKSPPIQK